MNKELEDALVVKYPKIFSRVKWFEHGDGWYNIIDSLCSCLQAESNRRIRELDKDDPEYPEKAEDLQVVAAQVKEKFGGLRFYIGSGSPEIYAMIRMAEAISTRTCEDCGSPGKTRPGGWIRTLCDSCAKAAGRNPQDRFEDEEG
jgi:hypothetical protein